MLADFLDLVRALKKKCLPWVPRSVYTKQQCCGSKFIEFRSGSRVLVQFGILDPVPDPGLCYQFL